MRKFTLSMLGLYVALAHAGASAAPSLTLDRNVIDSETSQWLAPTPAVKQAERLQLTARAAYLASCRGASKPLTTARMAPA